MSSLRKIAGFPLSYGHGILTAAPDEEPALTGNCRKENCGQCQGYLRGKRRKCQCACHRGKKKSKPQLEMDPSL